MKLVRSCERTICNMNVLKQLKWLFYASVISIMSDSLVRVTTSNGFLGTLFIIICTQHIRILRFRACDLITTQTSPRQLNVTSCNMKFNGRANFGSQTTECDISEMTATGKKVILRNLHIVSTVNSLFIASSAFQEHSARRRDIGG